MDEVVMVRRSFLNRLRAFINIFASRCRVCLRKANIGCSDCDYNRATGLISEIDNVRNAKEEQYWQDNPVQERREMILRALRQAGRPLMSSEIVIDGVSRSLKGFTLKQMCKRRILGSRVNAEGRYEFFILDGSQRPSNRKQKAQKEKLKWHST